MFHLWLLWFQDTLFCFHTCPSSFYIPTFLLLVLGWLAWRPKSDASLSSICLYGAWAPVSILFSIHEQPVCTSAEGSPYKLFLVLSGQWLAHRRTFHPRWPVHWPESTHKRLSWRTLSNGTPVISYDSHTNSLHNLGCSIQTQLSTWSWDLIGADESTDAVNRGPRNPWKRGWGRSGPIVYLGFQHKFQFCSAHIFTINLSCLTMVSVSYQRYPNNTPWMVPFPLLFISFH